MFDEGLAWKIAFGALVLAFSGVSWLTRTADSATDANVVILPVRRAPPAAAPLPAASAPALPDPIPDVAEAPEIQEDAPVRVHLPAAQPPAGPKKSARRVPSSKVHLVRHRSASPYATGRKHYPFEPKDRWRNGYA